MPYGRSTQSPASERNSASLRGDGGAQRVVLEDQALRDGFQAEALRVPTERKLRFVSGLIEAGVRRIQVCSFVSPRAVPQMADAEALCAALPARDDVLFSGLVLNERGVERALGAGLRHVACSLSASDTHGRKNTRMGLAEARAELARTIRMAKAAGATVRAGVQCAFGCRDEGEVRFERVLGLVEELLAHGADEVALADSTGMAHPDAVRALSRAALELAGQRPLFLHLHDTEGRALANALASLEVGVRHFDGAFAGMGGCPNIPGASGNLATEDLVATLALGGFETGIDARKLAALASEAEALFEKRFPGKMQRVFARPDLATLVS